MRRAVCCQAGLSALRVAGRYAPNLVAPISSLPRRTPKSQCLGPAFQSTPCTGMALMERVRESNHRRKLEGSLTSELTRAAVQ